MHLKKNIMRKTYLALLVLTAGLLSGNQVVHASDPAHAEQSSVAPAEGISQLKEGNGRYTNSNPQHPRQSSEEREKLTKISIRLRSFSAALIRAFRPRPYSIKGSAIYLWSEWQEM